MRLNHVLVHDFIRQRRRRIVEVSCTTSTFCFRQNRVLWYWKMKSVRAKLFVRFCFTVSILRRHHPFLHNAIVQTITDNTKTTRPVLKSTHFGMTQHFQHPNDRRKLNTHTHLYILGNQSAQYLRRWVWKLR